MTVIFYDSKEAPDSTPNTFWTEHASKQGTLNARKHWVWATADPTALTCEPHLISVELEFDDYEIG